MQIANTHTLPANLDVLLKLIERSAFLSTEQQAQVREFAERSDQNGRDQLLKLLLSESDVVQNIVKETVKHAAQEGRQNEACGKIDEFLHQANRYLSKSSEHVEHSGEVATAESLLDNA